MEIKELLQHGLGTQQVNKLHDQYGTNQIKGTPPPTEWTILIRQFKNPLVLVLVVAGIITFGLALFEHDSYSDTIVISLAIVVNTVLGFIQERNAQKGLESLKKVLTPHAVVIRNGQQKTIEAQDIVPGDLLLLYEGDKIAADGILLKSTDLLVNEAILTGESEPVGKHVSKFSLEKIKKTLKAEDAGNLTSTQKQDHTITQGIKTVNRVYMGTLVIKGTATVLVTTIGMQTEIGKIALSLEGEKDTQTPLEMRLSQLAKWLTWIVFLSSILVFMYGYFIIHMHLKEIFSLTVALAVAAIPEGLVVSLTAILAIGMQRILKKQALVRKMVAAETLGTVTVVCVDKTGTLTEGKLKVVDVEFNDWKLGLRASALANDLRDGTELARWSWLRELSREQNDATIVGAPLVGAETVGAPLVGAQTVGAPLVGTRSRAVVGTPLVGAETVGAPLVGAQTVGAASVGVQTVGAPLVGAQTVGARSRAGTRPAPTPDPQVWVDEYPRDETIPFSSDTKFLATRHDNEVFIVGAPEVVLGWTKSKSQSTIHNRIESWGSKGYRMIGFGYYKAKNARLAQHFFQQLHASHQPSETVKWLGLMAYTDPIREGVKKSIKQAFLAGINLKVITGDYRQTAVAVLKQLDVDLPEGSIMEGFELGKLSDQELQTRINQVKLFARTKPNQKMRIVKALKANHQVVAMMGDGVNDAPALAAADIGIVVGEASEVAREQSDMVLLDSNFQTILDAVAEGRGIFDNLRKIVLYLLSDVFTEMILVVGSMVAGWPLAITAVQILWVNLVGDGLPNLALTVDPRDRNVLKRKPVDSRLPLIDKEMLVIMGVIGSATGLAGLAAFRWAYPIFGVNHGQTVSFMVLGIGSLFYVFSCRVLEKNIWEKPFWNNQWLILSSLLGIILMVLPLYTPGLNTLLGIAPLGITEWIIVVIASMFVVISVESVKWAWRYFSR